MYARGILFGKMKYELGDHSVVRCPETGLVADLEFKTKGWVGGTYNAIGGTVKNEKTGEVLYEFSGLWSDEMFVKDLKVRRHVTGRSARLRHTDRFVRLATRRCSSMHTGRSHHRPRSGHWISKMSANLKNSGTRPHRLSKIETTNSQPTRKQKLKTRNETRLQRGRKTGLNGTHAYLGGSRVVQAALKRARKTLSGSSTRKCGHLYYLSQRNDWMHDLLTYLLAMEAIPKNSPSRYWRYTRSSLDKSRTAPTKFLRDQLRASQPRPRIQSSRRMMT